MKKDYILMQSNKFCKDERRKEFDEENYNRFIQALKSERVKSTFSSFVAVGTKEKDGKKFSLHHFYFVKAEKLKEVFPYEKDRSQTIIVQNDSDVVLFDYKNEAVYRREIWVIKKCGKVVLIGKDLRKAFGYLNGKLYCR